MYILWDKTVGGGSDAIEAICHDVESLRKHVDKYLPPYPKDDYRVLVWNESSSCIEEQHEDVAQFIADNTGVWCFICGPNYLTDNEDYIIQDFPITQEQEESGNCKFYIQFSKNHQPYNYINKDMAISLGKMYIKEIIRKYGAKK